MGGQQDLGESKEGVEWGIPYQSPPFTFGFSKHSRSAVLQRPWTVRSSFGAAGALAVTVTAIMARVRMALSCIMKAGMRLS